MIQARNIIEKQFVEVSYNGVIDPFTFRDQLSSVCQSILLPAIEKLFDKISPTDRIFKYDKLVIDIGEIPSDNWESILVEKVIEAFSQQILPSSSYRTYSHFSETTYDLNKKNIRKEVDVKENLKQSVFYFLETGLLKWNALIKDKESLNEGLTMLIKDPASLSQLIEMIKSNQNALDRLIYQFNEELLDKLIKDSVSFSQGTLEDLKYSFKAIAKEIEHPATKQKHLIYEVFLSSINKSQSENDYIKLVIDNIFQKTHFTNWLKIVSEKTEKNNEQAIINLIQKIIPSEKISQNILNYINSTYINSTESAKSNYENSKINKKNKEVEATKAIKIKEEEWYINNAGLVLLHPFLALLFENVGYTENKAWISEESQQRAIILTQFLITGKEVFLEFDLFLNKIITGYPLEKTLPTEIVLSEYETQEGHDVLQSVIKHWDALKNTTIYGLQSTFLQREGKLSKEPSSWNLVVEQKTVDILMNKLPWGISMVKTPWMKTMLKVEWT